LPRIINHPTLPIALFVARRPGTESYLIDLRDGRLLQTVTSQPHRHFYGHAVIHKGGEWLYATENDTTDPGRGVLGVYRFEGERLVHTGEISTHGIGPHEVAWLPDGETLVVANGGIRTEAESRVEMNLDAMQPSLVLMQRDGTLLSKETLAQQMNSVRHLAVGTTAPSPPASSSWAARRRLPSCWRSNAPASRSRPSRCPSGSCSRWPSTPPASPSTATCAWWR
jgi:hypothetical protein